MQEVKERKYDCIVVGGGASGLAAISAMADLGVTNTILLERSSEVGGCLLSDSERLSLSGKAFSGKELFPRSCFFYARLPSHQTTVFPFRKQCRKRKSF